MTPVESLSAGATKPMGVETKGSSTTIAHDSPWLVILAPSFGRPYCCHCEYSVEHAGPYEDFA